MAKNKYKASKAQEKELREDMIQLSHLLFLLYGEASFDEIGERAKLHPNTVRNLWGGVTQFPQFRTIQKLAFGVGVSVEITGHDLTVSSVG